MLSYFIKVKKFKNEKPSWISNHTMETIYLKKTRALAGNTTYKMVRWTTIWSDLNMSSIYSTHPYPTMFNIIAKIKTISINLFMYSPDLFNDCAWELFSIYFFTLWVKFQYAMFTIILFFFETKRYWEPLNKISS